MDSITHSESRPRGRRERKKAETRRRLYEAAVTLFAERGYEGTRVEDITERADVAVGTFFNYFPTKDAVLQELQRREFDEIVEHARMITSGGAQARFRAQFDWLVSRTAGDAGRLMRIYVGRIVASPGITGPIRPLVYALWDVYERWLEEGKRSGEVRADLDARTAAELLHEIWWHNLTRWSTHPDEIRLRERMRRRLKLMFDGLGAR